MSYARLKLIGMLHVKGPMIMSELGARLDVSARNITKLVDALEHEGLVRRVAHCTDRRATVIEITPEGSKVGEQVWGDHCRAMSTLFDELSEVDRADLLTNGHPSPRRTRATHGSGGVKPIPVRRRSGRKQSFRQDKAGLNSEIEPRNTPNTRKNATRKIKWKGTYRRRGVFNST